MHLKLLFFVLITRLSSSFSQEFKIGGVFHREENNNETSLEEIIFLIASQSSGSENDDTTLTPIIEKSDQYNSIAVRQSGSNYDVVRYNATMLIACELLNEQVMAIFGPQLSESSQVVKAICDTKEIPNIQTRYDSNQRRGSCGVNLYPHQKALSKAYVDIIKKWQWKSFIIVYEDNESLLRLNNLLKWDGDGETNVKLMQLPEDDNYITLFRSIRHSGETKILLDCSTHKLSLVLQQAQQVGVMIEDYSFIITSLDLQTVDLDPYKYSGVNITGFRLIDPTQPEVASKLKMIEDNELLAQYNGAESLLKVEVALLYDAVQFYKSALKQFEKNENAKVDRPTVSLTDVQVPTCWESGSWKFGTSLVNLMKMTEMSGLSGKIKFDNEGFRTNIKLQIIELREEGFVDKGAWHYDEKTADIHTKIIPSNPPPSNEKNLETATLNIVISLTKPYGMRKQSATKLEGNERYEGFSVDFIKELSLLRGFKYNLLVQEDGANGQLTECPNMTKQCWDGMVGKVYHGEADLAIADITISKDRAHYIAFSSPFMNLGISILYIKPRKETPSLFSFLFPFSTTVWLLVVTAYIGVSLSFFVMARLTPHEWRNPYPCVKEPEELENQFTLINSFWFTIGALMQQGSDIAPVSPSTRIAAGVWWFFTLIMVSSYTANLAAFLTVESEVLAFKDAKELSRQTQIKYGAKKMGTTFNFFKDSPIEHYQHIHKFMVDNPDYMTKDNEEGVRNVIEGGGSYAFFMESSAIEYEKEQHCELAQVGGLLDNKNYGIAMRKNEWFENEINQDVLVLQEKGKLTTLRRKWWKEKYSKNCQENEKHDAQKLHLNNVGGVFLVLIAGVAIAFVVMLFEVYFHLKSSIVEKDAPLLHAFLKEMKFIMKCKTLKPTQASGETSLISRSDVASSTERNSRRKICS